MSRVTCHNVTTHDTIPHYRCYVWSETQAKVVEFSQVCCMLLQINMS